MFFSFPKVAISFGPAIPFCLKVLHRKIPKQRIWKF